MIATQIEVWRCDKCQKVYATFAGGAGGCKKSCMHTSGTLVRKLHLGVSWGMLRDLLAEVNVTSRDIMYGLVLNEAERKNMLEKPPAARLEIEEQFEYMFRNFLYKQVGD